MSRKRPAPRPGSATQPALWAGAADEPAGSAGPSCPVQPERDARVKRAQRGQITWGRVDLDAEVPADHEVRAIAAVVDQLDLRGLYADVRARGEIAGAPATDPKILLGLWVYATRDGVGSGREIARLVELHAAYRWLCGGVAVAYHRLNDFRSDRGEVFSELVTSAPGAAHETRPHRSPSASIASPRTAPASARPPALRRFEPVTPSSD